MTAERDASDARSGPEGSGRERERNGAPHGQAARIAAYRLLRDVGAGAYADVAARRRFAGLTGRDRALARELAFGVVRLRARIDAELKGLSSRPLERSDPAGVEWLRLGLYQLRELRIPDHAAVHSSVEGARCTSGGGAARFVNAVLRRAVREGRSGRSFPAREVDPVGYLSTFGSHPEWLVRRWLARWPLASVERLVENDNRPPHVTLRLLEDCPSPEAQVLEPGPGVRLVRHGPGRSVYRLAAGEPREALRRLRSVVQDPAASLVVDYVGDEIEGPVLDVCAAPGGKALALAWSARRARPFVAADVRPGRLGRLREGISRTGADVCIVAMDGRAPAVRWARTVIIDAPCTGTGVLRRRPDARWRVTPERLDSLRALQSELLTSCAERVAPGGLLVYATCSLEPEENEEQAERFLTRHPAFKREPRSAGIPPEFLDPAGDLRVLPWLANTDGAYAVRLRRRGST